MTNPGDSDSPTSLQSYLELLRLPNVFTALADVTMGFFFVVAGSLEGGEWAFTNDGQQSLSPLGMWTLGLVAAASALLYSAGMTLNDVFDIELDREEQPDRPLPSGRIPLGAARWLGWQLLTLGIMLASAAAVILDKFPAARVNNFVLTWRPALVAAVLAVLIVLYNAGLKRTPLGPLAMGSCRMLNVLLGMSVLRGPWRIEHWVTAAGIGVYIAGVTWFARNDARRSDRRQLAAATLLMLGGIGLIASLPMLTDQLAIFSPQEPALWQWYMFVAMWGVYVLIHSGAALAQPSPGPVRGAVRHLITALIFLDTAACCAGAGKFYAIAVAILVIPMTVLSRWVHRG
jgi:4-hydroxybenzoate polyprenyltransferase